MTGHDLSRRDRFTVITPNYSMGALLPATIESVLSNLAPGDEYYVIDGGSRDESVAVLKRYESRLSGWVSEPDGGYADALAKGFASARGALLCWLNSGDLLLAGALDRARTELADGATDFIFGDDFYIDESDRVIQLSRAAVRSLRRSMLYGGWTPLQDACFWRRALYEKVGGIDRTLRFAADYDLFLRFSLTGAARYVPAAFSAFRRHEGQKSISGSLAYQRERQACAEREMRRLGVPAWSRVIGRTWYGLSVRVRSRLLRHHWDIAPLRGARVLDLPCQNYA